MAFLAIVNIAIFVLLQVADRLHPLTGSQWLQFLGLPLAPLQVFTKPWTMLTYMFVHSDFFHLIFNLIGLGIFGFWLSQTAGRLILVPLYLLGGLCGAVLTLTVAHIPGAETLFRHEMLLGATPCVMAIVLASVLFMPDHIIHLYLLFPVKMKYLGLGLVAVDLISLLFLHNPGGHLSHLGGAAVGWLFIRSFPRRERRRLMSLSDLLKHSGVTDFDRIMAGKRPLNDEEQNTLRISREEQLDRILDKINREGLHSLTNAEKKFLDDYSRSLQ
ncbi:MAG: rhomboid family intramembrane serine protease [Flavobacteriales bacterium]|nr:rhomboid family intramembrane serine protease [Flavobacteriales bacterium]MDW8409299.1 rhomboid family intramembrane serine protease [Flavobacteriales bacterium]